MPEGRKKARYTAGSAGNAFKLILAYFLKPAHSHSNIYKDFKLLINKDFSIDQNRITILLTISYYCSNLLDFAIYKLAT